MSILSLVGWAAAGIFAMAVGSSSFAEERPEPARTGAPSPATPPDTSPLVHEADLNVPVEKVWEVFTTDDGLKMLGVAQAKIDLRVGGKIQTHYDPKGVIGDDGTIEQTILAFEPMRVLAYRITKPPKGFPFMEAYRNMWSVATITDLGSGRSHLRLACMGYTADEESQRMRAFFDQGNAWVMQTLKKNLEGSGTADGGGDRTAGAASAPPAGSNASSGSSGSSASGASIATRATHASNASAPLAASAAPGTTKAGGGQDPLAPIVTETVVSAPVADAWKCWTTSEGIASFLTEAKVELRVGGPFEVYFGPPAAAGQRGSEGCTVLSYEPMSMLSFSWNAPPKFGPLREKHTWVVVHLDPYGPHSCRVRLKHLGFSEQAGLDPDHSEGWKEVRAYFADAWPSVLDALREHFEVAEKGSNRAVESEKK